MRMSFFVLLLSGSIGFVQSVVDVTKQTETTTRHAVASTQHEMRPEITAPPSIEELRRRQTIYQGTVYYAPSNVCGYVSASSSKYLFGQADDLKC